MLFAFGQFNEGGGGSVHFRPIQGVRLSADLVMLSVGGGCCPLSVRMYVNFYYKRGGVGAIQYRKGGGGA